MLQPKTSFIKKFRWVKGGEEEASGVWGFELGGRPPFTLLPNSWTAQSSLNYLFSSGALEGYLDPFLYLFSLKTDVAL